MACYHPMQGFRSTSGGITFSRKYAFQDLPPVQIPCGQCVGCRLERSRQWAMRIMHEASLHETNCFLTLTYDDENCPGDMSLDKKHFQDFMKRLRKEHNGRILRYYHCGEYGDTTHRPHYHVCLFNYDFPDKVYYKTTETGNNLYTSQEAEKIWGMGFAPVGDLTFESAAYTARYVMKKVTGKNADDHYKGRQPEYTTMSRRPGIGKNWYNQWATDVYPHDFTVVNGKKMRPPKAYDTYYEQDGGDLEAIKKKRRTSGRLHKENNTKERLAVREEIQELKVKKLQRTHDA